MSEEIISETIRRIEPEGPEGGYILVGTIREGRLYLAERQGKRFVLKTPGSDSGRDRELLRREWEMSMGLSHPNLSYVFAWEEQSPVGPCLVQEYVDGRTLAEYLGEKPGLPARKRVFLQLLAATAYLHGKGIIHNDLSPANILITRTDNDVKLIDLGFSDDDTHYLLKGLGGTPGYASPELLSGGRIDARSDIWTLGRLMKDIFPHRYRRIAAKCRRENPSGRYPSVEALERAFRRRGQALRYGAMGLAAVLMAAAFVWMGSRQRQAEAERSALELRADSLSRALKAIDDEKARQEAAVQAAKDYIDKWYRTESAAYLAALKKACSREEANAAWMDLTERYNKLYSDSIGMVPSERHGAIMSYLQKSYQNKLMPLYDALIQRIGELTP